MAQLNNVNLEGAMAFASSIQKDSSKAKKTQIIEGDWVLDEGGPQFRVIDVNCRYQIFSMPYGQP